MSTFSTLKAAWPVLKRAIASGQIVNPQCELVDPDPDTEALYDVEIPISEGFALTANVFRSRHRHAAGEKTPVIMCAHPYDNHKTPALKGTPLGGPPQQYRLLPQAGEIPKFSTLTSWESPDPDFWVQAGYTLINLNLPGYSNSGGPASIMSAHQGKCFREAIAWAGEQEWCTGSVGLCGVSFLCISQYLAAAAPDGEAVPDALKCIIPWEGVSDLYQDLACRGGVADTGFLNFWWHTEVNEALNVPLEDYLAVEEAIPPETVFKHPHYDEYWRKKAPPLQNITVPMMVCGSFSDHELHTFGSFRAFERSGSSEKWLYTHRSGKWTEFYKDECLALQKAFMDHFLKGETTQFPSQAAVRIEVRKSREDVSEVRWESEWPLARTDYTPVYLSEDALRMDPSKNEGEYVYDGSTGKTEFSFVFDHDTELTGYMKLRVWVEARSKRRGGTPPRDLILCCYIDKRDRSGKTVRFNGAIGSTQDVVSRGYGRAARRELDPMVSTPWHPQPLAARDQWLEPGEIVPLDIAFCPSSTFFEAGEQLTLIVSSQDFIHAPIFKKDTRLNEGRHVIHYGGAYDSHLLIPKIRTPGSF